MEHIRNIVLETCDESITIHLPFLLTMRSSVIERMQYWKRFNHFTRRDGIQHTGSVTIIIGEDSRNVWSRAGPELHTLVITGELKIICTPRQILQALDANIIFINEGIDINMVVFDYVRSTVVSTAIVIHHTVHTLKNKSTKVCTIFIFAMKSQSIMPLPDPVSMWTYWETKSPVDLLIMWMKNGTMEFWYNLSLSLYRITIVMCGKIHLMQFNISSMSNTTQVVYFLLPSVFMWSIYVIYCLVL